MDGAIITTLIVGVLSSASLVALINGLFQRKRDKESKATGLESKINTILEDQNDIKKTLRKQEIDQIRTEMKLMIYNDPSKEDDLLRMGQHYFVDLDANWTMGKTYTEWLRSRGIEIPQWVRED